MTVFTTGCRKWVTSPTQFRIMQYSTSSVCGGIVPYN